MLAQQHPFKLNNRLLILGSAIGLTTLLSACGGGGGGGGGGSSSFVEPVVATPAVSPTDSLAQSCSTSNPFRQDALKPTTVGTLSSEKQWLRSYMGDTYLWYSEIPNVNADASAYSANQDVYTSLNNYFNDLRSPFGTTSGKRKDAFSFIYPTKDWTALSQAGTVFGYGMELRVGSTTPPRRFSVVYVEPNSVAERAGVRRGDQIVSINNISVDVSDRASIDAFNNALSPKVITTNSFVFSRNGVTQPAVALRAGTVTQQPVMLSKVLTAGDQKIGYMLFNSHLGAAESGLIKAMEQFSTANVTDLVIDMRYNGGGYLYIASELAYMIAGGGRTKGKVFEQLQYNDKRANDSKNSAEPFYDTSCLPGSDGKCTTQAALPTLNLPRVYILTTNSTCSASESVINGLRGIDIDVRVIGSNTCGKPYGFLGRDNCGISYFPIEFKGVNNKGFGDYADGFVPNCSATDDLSKELGDPNENILATALQHRSSGACKPIALSRSSDATRASDAGFLLRDPVLENRFLGPQRP